MNKLNCLVLIAMVLSCRAPVPERVAEGESRQEPARLHEPESSVLENEEPPNSPVAELEEPFSGRAARIGDVNLRALYSNTCVWRNGHRLRCVGSDASLFSQREEVLDVWPPEALCTYHMDGSYRCPGLDLSWAQGLSPQRLSVDGEFWFSLADGEISMRYREGEHTEVLGTLQAPEARELVFRRDNGCARLSNDNWGCWPNRGYWTKKPEAERRNKWGKLVKHQDQERQVIQVTAGGRHHCFLDDKHKVACFRPLGVGDHLGTLGQEGRVRECNIDDPMPVLLPFDAVQLASAKSYNCARSADGRLACWGRVPWPYDPTHPDGPRQDDPTTTTPQLLPLAESVVDMSLAEFHMCVVTSDERVLCWGENGYGQLGVEPRPTSSATPLFIPDIDDAVDLAAGSEHACVKRKDGSLWCWGSNEDGRLGRETIWKRWAVPLKVEAFQGDIAQFGLARTDTCVRYTDGRLACLEADRYPFDKDQNGSSVTLLAKDFSLTIGRLCLVHSDDKVYCAGGAYYGPGDYIAHWDFFPDRGKRATRDVIGRVNSVQTGGEMDCAIRANDRAVCWGRVPELPDAECSSEELEDFCVVAKPFEALGRVQSLTVGAAHACAVTESEGRVYCWGF
ncbi:MAG: hypothetical protein RBU37_27930, partial [Myxococcota bacterium]|nr:hypothetical protein [Myxococcota bacterium]